MTITSGLTVFYFRSGKDEQNAKLNKMVHIKLPADSSAFNANRVAAKDRPAKLLVLWAQRHLLRMTYIIPLRAGTERIKVSVLLIRCHFKKN